MKLWMLCKSTRSFCHTAFAVHTDIVRQAAIRILDYGPKSPRRVQSLA